VSAFWSIYHLSIPERTAAMAVKTVSIAPEVPVAVLTVTEAATFLRIGENGMRELIAAGEVEATRVGPAHGRTVVSVESLHAYLRRCFDRGRPTAATA